MSILNALVSANANERASFREGVGNLVGGISNALREDPTDKIAQAIYEADFDPEAMRQIAIQYQVPMETMKSAFMTAIQRRKLQKENLAVTQSIDVMDPSTADKYSVIYGEGAIPGVDTPLARILTDMATKEWKDGYDPESGAKIAIGYNAKLNQGSPVTQGNIAPAMRMPQPQTQGPETFFGAGGVVNRLAGISNGDVESPANFLLNKIQTGPSTQQNIDVENTTIRGTADAQAEAAAKKAAATAPYKAGGDTAKQRAYEALVNIGTDPDTATKIVYGALRLGTDAEGYSTVHDLTQAGKPQPAPTAGPQPVTQQPQSLPGEQQQEKPWRQQEGFLTSQDLLGGTGPAAKIREKISNIGGPTASPEGGALFGETLESQNKIKMFNQSVIAGFANNPRIPVAEQNLVKGFLPDPDKFWTDRRGELQKLNNMRDFLERRLENIDQALSSGNITKNQYNEFKELRNLMIGTLNMLGNTGLNQGNENGPRIQQEMPNFETMSDEELDAYLAR